MDKRWNDIKQIWLNSNVWLWFLPGLVLGIVVGLVLGTANSSTFSSIGYFFTKNWFADGIWPEVLGMIITVFIIDRLIDNKRKLESDQIEQYNALVRLRLVDAKEQHLILDYMNDRNLLKNIDFDKYHKLGYYEE